MAATVNVDLPSTASAWNIIAGHVHEQAGIGRLSYQRFNGPGYSGCRLVFGGIDNVHVVRHLFACKRAGCLSAAGLSICFGDSESILDGQLR